MQYALFLATGLLLTLVSSIDLRTAKAASLILLVYAVAFAGLRGASFDYDEYILIFDIVQASDIEIPQKFFLGKDVLFGALIVLLQWLNLGPQFLFLVSAVLSVGIKFHALTRIYGYTPAVVLAIIGLYFFLHDYTQVRIAIALSFCMLAFVKACQGERLQWACFGLLAIGFHFSTALVVAFMLPIVLALRNKILINAFTLSLILLTTNVIATNLLSLDDRAWVYLDSSYEISLKTLVIFPLKTAVLSYLAYSICRLSPESKIRRVLNESIRLVWIGLILFFTVGIFVPGVAFRIYDMFDAFNVFIIAGAFMQKSVRLQLIALVYCAVSVVNIAAAGLLIPYTFAPGANY